MFAINEKEAKNCCCWHYAQKRYNDMYSIEMAKFGEAICEARKYFGLTKKQVSSELKIPYNHVVAIEAGRSVNYRLHKNKLISYFEDQFKKKNQYYLSAIDKLNLDFHFIRKNINEHNL